MDDRTDDAVPASHYLHELLRREDPEAPLGVGPPVTFHVQVLRGPGAEKGP
jgi:hypothetical protein